MNENVERREERMRLYHACVKGYGDFTIYIDEADFITAVNYTALAQLRAKVGVLAYCHMPNHSHFILSAENIDDVRNFLCSFEQMYSMFFNMKYEGKNIFKRQDNFVKGIKDIMYLRKCIAYVLRNPLKAGLVKSSAGYPWSSQACYFSEEVISKEYFPISLLTARQIKVNLRTHMKLKDSGYYVNDRWMIAPKSFVDYKTVEAVYKNSANLFISYVGSLDDQKIEYDLMVKDVQKYDDIEIREFADKISEEKYKKQCEQLLPEQKWVIAERISKKYRTSAAQLSRVFKVRKDLLQSLFTSSEEEG